MGKCWNILSLFIAVTSILLENLIPGAVAQAENLEVQNVNILFFYEWESARKSFDVAVKYIRQHSKKYGITINKVYKFRSNGTDEQATILMDNICTKIKEVYGLDEKPDIVIDFTRRDVPSEAVKILTRNSNLPTISGSFGQEGDTRSWREIDEHQRSYLIQIAPAADLVPQVVRSLVAWQDMTSAVLLFDDDYEMYHKYKALLQNLPTRHLLTKLEKSTPAVRRQIDRLVHVDVCNFFIAAAPNEISAVLAEASSPNVRDGPYFSDEFAWYSISMEEGFPKCSACKTNVSVIHVTPIIKQSDRRTWLKNQKIFKKEKLTDMFYFDLAINAILAVAKMKREKNWYAPPSQTCGEKTEPNKDYRLELFDALNSTEIWKDNILGPFHLDVPEKGVGKSHVGFDMAMHRLVFKSHQAEPVSNVLLGTWRTGYIERELITTEGHEMEWKAHAILTVFRIVTHVQEPFVYKIPGCIDNTKENKYSRCFRGYCIDLLDKIQADLNFNYTIRNVTGYGYMSDDESHEWDGMIRELKDRKADIALGAISVMAERESVVDFTVPYYDLVGISILMRKTKIHTSLFKFLTVLENDVWYCILASYFFTSFLMWAFDRWSPYSYHNNMEKYVDDDDKREFNFKECLWFCMTSLTPQGGGEAPKNLSGRVVAATWWMFGFIIIASYTANLAAFLTVSRLDNPVESLEDLAKQYKVQYAPLKGSSAWIYFHRMKNIEKRFYEIWKDLSLNQTINDYDRAQISTWDYPVSEKFTKIWDAIQENGPPENHQDAVNRVRGKKGQKDEFAFLGDATDIRYQTVINCDLKMVGEEFSRKPYALAVQQGSPLKDQLNDAILKLLNKRELENLKEVWWTNNEHAKHCPKEENQSDGISIHNIGGVFIVIFVGILMACFTLIFEYWWNRNKDKGDVEDGPEEMDGPPQQPKEFVIATQKTNFNTQYGK